MRSLNSNRRRGGRGFGIAWATISGLAAALLLVAAQSVASPAAAQSVASPAAAQSVASPARSPAFGTSAAAPPASKPGPAQDSELPRGRAPGGRPASPAAERPTSTGPSDGRAFGGSSGPTGSAPPPRSSASSSPPSPGAHQGKIEPIDEATVIPDAEYEEEGIPAELVLNGQTVFVFRSRMGASTPAERRDRAYGRLETLASTGWTGDIASRPIPEGTLVTVGGSGAFAITPGDLDTSGGDRMERLTARTLTLLRSALTEERTARSTTSLVRGLILGAAGTFLFIILLRLLMALRRWALRRIPEKSAAQLKHVAAASFSLLSTERLHALLRRAIGLLSWGLGLFLAYAWFTFLLRQFYFSRKYGDALGAWLLTTIGELALAAIRAVPGLFVVVVIVLITRMLVRMAGRFFASVEKGDVEIAWLPPESAKPVRPIVVALLWIFAMVVSYPYVPGSGSDVFKGASVFAGLVLSLGSSGLTNQAMSGIVLMFARALKAGDYVQVNETEGSVLSVNLLSTKILTIKNEEVTIPNALLVSHVVKNFSRLAGHAGGLIIHSSVTIGYDAPWRQVHAMLLEAVRRTPALRTDPAPFVLQRALSDFYVEYEINARVDSPHDRVPVLSALHANIQDCFNENGVQIMSPHFLGQPEGSVVVPKDKWYTPPAKND